MPTDCRVTHDHNFDMEDVYDFERGEYRPNYIQMRAQCTNCKITLLDATQELLADCEIQLGMRKAQ